MIPLSTLKTELKRRLKKLAKGEALKIVTYKRDRGFILYAREDDTFTLESFGFQTELYDKLDYNEAIKLGERVIKREFPRSNQARVSQYKF